jgi:glycine oxidase
LRPEAIDRLSITVVGGGILGLWQSLTLARRGHRVTLREAAPQDSAGATSRFAGAMLAPYCASDAVEPIIQHLGLRGLELWRQTYPRVVTLTSPNQLSAHAISIR